MKRNFRGLGRKWQLALLVLAAVGPIGPSLYCYLLPQAWALSWVFAGICLVLAGIGMTFGGKRRKRWGYAGFAALVGAGLLLLPYTGRSFGYMLLFVPVLYGFALQVSLSMANLDTHKEPGGAVFLTGFFLYLFWQVFYRIRITEGDMAMEPAAWSIQLCFLIFLLLTLFSRSRSALSAASMGRFNLPPGMRRVNGLLILVFAAAVLLLGAVPVMGRVLAAPVVWVFQGLGGLLGVFLKLKPPGPQGAPTAPGEPDGTGIPDSDIPQLQAVTLPETVMQILLLVFAVVIMYFIVRAVRMLIRFVLELLQSMLRAGGDPECEYEDEISDVRDTHMALRPNRRTGRRSPGQRRSASEQIRYRYRVLRKRHPGWHKSQTVRDQLPEEAALLYERTRYGGKEAAFDDAKAFESKTRGL